MEYTKKMVLVPEYQLQTKPSQPSIQTYLSELDQEMQTILANTTMPVDVKAKEYNQILQRYLRFEQEA
jgi:hypothetical protein